MRRELIGAASAIALMTGAAFAQGTSTTDPSGTPAAESSMQSGAMETASAEEMIGMDVMGSDGEEIGSVEDVIIDPASGEAKQLVIASGGFLGIGEKQIAVDFSRVKVQAAQDGEAEGLTVADMTQADVEGMPEFQYSDTMTSLNRSGDAGGMSGSTGTTPGASGESGNMGAGGMTGGAGGTGATTGGGNSQ